MFTVRLSVQLPFRAQDEIRGISGHLWSGQGGMERGKEGRREGGREKVDPRQGLPDINITIIYTTPFPSRISFISLTRTWISSVGFGENNVPFSSTVLSFLVRY